MKYIWITIIAVIIIFGGIFLYRKHEVNKAPPVSQYKTTVLTMGGQQFTAQISDTPALQQLGLSYRQSIGTNDAMLFVFSAPGQYQFWMQAMNFPLDIIWLNSDKQIIYIEKDLSPATYPQSFGPTANSQYVIEVASGTADRLGLSNGEVASF